MQCGKILHFINFIFAYLYLRVPCIHVSLKDDCILICIFQEAVNVVKLWIFFWVYTSSLLLIDDFNCWMLLNHSFVFTGRLAWLRCEAGDGHSAALSLPVPRTTLAEGRQHSHRNHWCWLLCWCYPDTRVNVLDLQCGIPISSEGSVRPSRNNIETQKNPKMCRGKRVSETSRVMTYKWHGPRDISVTSSFVCWTVVA